tara:strand:+ start:3593 stop:4000 length:408 start_codon:yes stop_codon:yes gene_type:complete
MQECKIVRLTTKEVLICKVVPIDTNKENQEEILLQDPYEIKSFMNPQSGDFNSTLVDWLQFCDSNTTVIDTFNIITVNNPSIELKEHYEYILERRAVIESDDAFTKIKNPVKEPDREEYTLEDYMDMLNTSKTYH